LNKLKLWQKRYILSVKILLSVVFASTVGFIFYHVPYDSLFLYPFYMGAAFVFLYWYAIEDAKWDMNKEWQNWMDNKLNSKEYVDALLYIHHKQMNFAVDPTLPFTTTDLDLDYDAFLKEKFKGYPFIQELYK